MKQKIAQKVFFVDIRKHLIDKLHQRLKHYPQAHCLAANAKTLYIDDNSLVLLCGVGAFLIIECLNQYILQKNISTINFLISANMHTLELRNFLKENPFHCHEERIAVEKGRCYEILLVSYNRVQESSSVKLFNQQYWSVNNKNHVQYLKSKIKDLEKKSTLNEYELLYYQQVRKFL